MLLSSNKLMAYNSVLPFEFNPTETRALAGLHLHQGQQFLKVVPSIQYKKMSTLYRVNGIKYWIGSKRKSCRDSGDQSNHRQGTDKTPNIQNVMRKHHITPYHLGWLVPPISSHSGERDLYYCGGCWASALKSVSFSSGVSKQYFRQQSRQHLIHYSLVSRCLWSSASLPPAMKWIEHNSWRIMRPTRNVSQWNCR